MAEQTHASTYAADRLEKAKALYNLALLAYSREDQHLERVKRLVSNLFPFVTLTFIPATLVFVAFAATVEVALIVQIVVYATLVAYVVTFFVTGISMLRVLRREEVKTALSADAEEWMQKTDQANSVEVYDALTHMQMSFVKELRELGIKRYSRANQIWIAVATNFMSFVIYVACAGFAIFLA